MKRDYVKEKKNVFVEIKKRDFIGRKIETLLEKKEVIVEGK